MRNLARPLSNPVIGLCSCHGSADFDGLELLHPFEFAVFTSLGREGDVAGVTSLESLGGEVARSAEDEEDEARMLFFRSERSARLVARRLPPIPNALAPLDLGSKL